MILFSLFFWGLSLIRKLWVSKTHDVGANPTNPIGLARTFSKGTIGGEIKKNE